ncbi:MAG: hypothetical protein JW889_02605 [Verrucomicrobia bacterium]|nr:hypothetical protein [Verrucomicrobiota bacterium]
MKRNAKSRGSTNGSHACGSHACGSHAISTLNEGPLHAALKDWYARPGDETEVLVDGFLVDIVRDGLLIEVQTRGFSPLKRKLAKLVASHRVRLVYPIACEKWIVRTGTHPTKASGRSAGNGLRDAPASRSRRKSPKRGAVEDLFAELVAFPHLAAHRNFTLEVLLIREEEIRRHDASRAWRRRGWVTCERRLLDVVETRLFKGPAAFAALVSNELDEPFDTAQLAAALGRPRRLAQQAAYCLRGMGVIEPVGKRGNAVLYVRAAPRRRVRSAGTPAGRAKSKR